MVGSILGAVLGDSVSYWIGRRFGGGIAQIWPFSRNPELLPSGIQFFQRHGGTSVFIGRFFGPIRAVIPLAAGMMRMPRGRFWVANITSALVWAPMLLLVGDADRNQRSDRGASAQRARGRNRPVADRAARSGLAHRPRRDPLRRSRRDPSRPDRDRALTPVAGARNAPQALR